MSCPELSMAPNESRIVLKRRNGFSSKSWPIGVPVEPAAEGIAWARSYPRTREKRADTTPTTRGPWAVSRALSKIAKQEPVNFPRPPPEM